ncbi:MAG: hypothetical protein NTW66_02080 [Candidatus Magasanikbacteria bacterium]|nr:hypothetical protein [Candidatus Magasanikbacteria bacterium]
MAINKSEQTPKTEAPAEAKQPEKIPKRPGLFREIMAKVVNIGSEKYWTDMDKAIFAEIEAGEKEEQLLKDAAKDAKKEIFSQAEEVKLKLQEDQRLINTMKEGGTIAPKIAEASVDTLARLDAMMGDAQKTAETGIDAGIPTEESLVAANQKSAETAPEMTDLEAKIAQLKTDADNAEDENEKAFYLSEVDRLTMQEKAGELVAGMPAAEQKFAEDEKERIGQGMELLDAVEEGAKKDVIKPAEKINLKPFEIRQTSNKKFAAKLPGATMELADGSHAVVSWFEKEFDSKQEAEAAIAAAQKNIEKLGETDNKPLIPKENPRSTGISADGSLTMKFPDKKIVLENDKLFVFDLDENGQQTGYHIEPIVNNESAIAKFKQAFESTSAEDLKKYNVDKTVIELLKGKPVEAAGEKKMAREKIPSADPDTIGFSGEGDVGMNFGKDPRKKAIILSKDKITIFDFDDTNIIGHTVEAIGDDPAAIEKFKKAFENVSVEEMKNNKVDQSVIDLLKGETAETPEEEEEEEEEDLTTARREAGIPTNAA